MRKNKLFLLSVAAICAALIFGCTSKMEKYNAAYMQAKTMYDGGNYKGILNMILPGAEDGHTPSAFLAGEIYYNGQGVAQDCQKAIYYYKKAAVSDALAQYRLGMIYKEGRCVPQDYYQAADWFEKSARQNNGDALYEAGLINYHGRTGSKNYAVAMDYFTRSGALGNDKADYMLGRMYQDGTGVQKSILQAITYYEKAAQKDNVLAQLALADIYLKGGPGVKPNKEKAMKLLKTLSDKGYGRASYQIAKMYDTGKKSSPSMETAARWYLKSARQGYPEGQYKTAMFYHLGYGFPYNFNQSLYWFRQAGDNGVVDAQMQAAELYSSSQVSSRYQFYAYKYYTLASKCGDKKIRDSVLSKRNYIKGYMTKRNIASATASASAAYRHILDLRNKSGADIIPQ